MAKRKYKTKSLKVKSDPGIKRIITGLLASSSNKANSQKVGSNKARNEELEAINEEYCIVRTNKDKNIGNFILHQCKYLVVVELPVQGAISTEADLSLYLNNIKDENPRINAYNHKLNNTILQKNTIYPKLVSEKKKSYSFSLIGKGLTPEFITKKLNMNGRLTVVSIKPLTLEVKSFVRFTDLKHIGLLGKFNKRIEKYHKALSICQNQELIQKRNETQELEELEKATKIIEKVNSKSPYNNSKKIVHEDIIAKEVVEKTGSTVGQYSIRIYFIDDRLTFHATGDNTPKGKKRIGKRMKHTLNNSRVISSLTFYS